MDAARIRILIEADAANLTSGLAAASAALSAFGATSTSTLGRISTAFNSLSTAQRTLGVLGVGVAGIGAALATTIAPAIQFESAFAGVLKTVEGTPAQIDGIRQGLLDLSRVMPTSATELAGIAEAAGQLGIAAPDVLEFTEVVAQLGETTNLSFEQAGTQLARFLNVTGNTADVSRLSDSLVVLGNNTATTESEILTLSLRLGSAFSQAGASEAQILGLAASMSSLGIEAEAGGTAASRVIREITDAVANGGPELALFADTAGLLPDQFEELVRTDPTAAVLAFASGLSDLSASGRSTTPILEDLGLTGERVQDTLRRLGAASEASTATIGLSVGAYDEAGARAEEYAKRTETTAAQLEILRGRLNAVAIEIGTPFLDGIVDGADAAGDAIEALVQILAPVAAELQTTFGNLGTLVSAFYDVIGGPALQVAVAGLTGLAVSATALLEALNALGPAGLVIAILAADIALVGPASIAANTAVTSLSASVATTGVAATATSTAVKGLQAALAVGPLVAAAAALVVVGKAFRDADAAATEAGDSFRTAITESLDEASLAGVTAGLDAIVERQAQLRQELAAADQAIGLSGDSWFNLGQAIQGTVEVLTPLENTILNNQRELEELDAVLGELQLGNFEDSVSSVATELDLTNDAVIAIASELGVLQDLTQGSVGDFYTARDAIIAYTSELGALEDVTSDVQSRIFAGTATLEEFADAVGISADNVATLAELSGNTEAFDSLFSDDLGERAAGFASLTSELQGTITAMAEAAGLGADEFLTLAGAATDAAAAHNDLRAAVSGVQDALATLGAQQEITNKAVAAFEESLGSIGTDGGVSAAEALRTATIETAALTGSVQEAEAAQLDFAASFLEAAANQGIAQDEALDTLATYGLFPPELLTVVAFEGEEAARLAEEQLARQEELAKDIEAKLGLDTEDAAAAAEALIGDLETYGLSEFVAELDADPEAASSGIAIARGEAEGYEDTYEATLTADASQAEEAAQLAQDFVEGFAAQYNAELTAEDAGASEVIDPLLGQAATWEDVWGAEFEASDNGATTIVEQLIALASEYAKNYDADLTATDEGAGATLDDLTAEAELYDSSYNASLTATDDGASGEIAEQQSAADTYDDGYNASLTATDDGAGSEIASQTAAANSFAGVYTATLTAIDNASGVIGGAISALSGFVSRTITLTTVNRTISQGATGIVSGVTSSSSSGGSSGGAGGTATFFADGGFFALNQGGIPDVPDLDPRGIPRGALIERPGGARIYSARYPGRFFAEPVTGGEAYIPLSMSKRESALGVFEQVGRIFGIFADGGLAGTGGMGSMMGAGFTFAPQINIPVTAAAGQSPDAIAALVADRVDHSMNRFARQLANTRTR